MYLGLIILVAIVAVLLILVVLVQNSKGGGLSSEFSGGTSQMFGVKKTTDLLEQITWGLASAIILISLASYIMVGSAGTEGGIKSVNVEKAKNTVIPSGNIAPAPAGQTAPAAAPADSTKK